MPDAQTLIVEDDDALHVTYHPPDAWDRLSSADYKVFHGSSYHYTYAVNASLIFIFNGSYVEYYSDSNRDHGDFLVSLDEHELTTGTSFAPSWSYGPALFNVTVDPGPHTLRIENMEEGKRIALDYLIYSPLTSPTTVVTAAPGPSAPRPSDTPSATPPITLKPLPSISETPRGHDRMSTGLICGLAGILLALLGAAVLLLFQRAKKRQTRPFIIAHDPPPYSERTNREEKVTRMFL